jgi:spermidine/putrescine transport system substrate-binding protein
MDINAEFEELTGIQVFYSTFSTNEELYSKPRGGGASYDVVIPSDYLIGKMITEDMLEPLDMENIPNFQYIDEKFKNPLYDPENGYSVPYTWGYTGIIYNKDMVYEDEINSWSILWDEKYLGEILMFANPRDAFSIAEASLGYSMNTTSPDELQDCLELLKAQKPLVQAYVMDEIFDKMLGGEAALAPYYAGDAVTMMAENETLGFAVPSEGTNLFVDAMCIPKGSRSKEAAEMYINFLTEPEVSAANSEYIGYAVPSTAATEVMDPEFAANEVAYPPEEALTRAEYFGELPRETSLLMDRMWAELLSSDEAYSRLLMPVLLLAAIALSVAINLRRRVKGKKEKKYF